MSNGGQNNKGKVGVATSCHFLFCKCSSPSLSLNNNRTSQRIHKVNQTIFWPLI